MNDYTNNPQAANFDASGGDPLDRLIEAFVDLSVPEGPDAATKQALVAQLVGRPTDRVSRPEGSPRRALAQTWSFVMQTLATAALIVIAATAVIAVLRRDPVADDSAVPNPQEFVATPSSSVDAAAALVASGDDLKELLDFYMKTRTRLAQSQSWQQAHQRLSSALERPEVIGLGVGLLGAVPWASYARF